MGHRRFGEPAFPHVLRRELHARLKIPGLRLKTQAVDRAGAGVGRSCGWSVEVVALAEIVDQPGMSRLPHEQFAGERARRGAVEPEEPGQPREMRAGVFG